MPTCGRDELHTCLDALRPQVDGIVLVTNGPYTWLGHTGDDFLLVHDAGADVNISRWWNLGILEVREHLWDLPAWDVLVVNDDVVMGLGSVAALQSGLRTYMASLAFPGPREQLLSPNAPERITGWCFMLRGEQGMEVDESYAWWAGDNDLDVRARFRSGSLMVPGVDVTHTAPNAYTNHIPGLAQQAGRDVEHFRQRYGRMPY